MHQDKAVGLFIGSAIGDALGAPNEFIRERDIVPIKDMVGGGVHGCAVGETTDDTAMMMAIADAYITHKRFAPEHIAQNFLDWRKTGKFGTRDYVFDIGNTCSDAINLMTPDRPYVGRTHAGASGNGSIMRLAPIMLANHTSVANALAQSIAVSLMTHGNSDIVHNTTAFVCELFANQQLEEFEGCRNYSIRQQSGTGSIMHAYNMAWHCVNETHSFEDALLMAVNKGNDADTVGAVTGMLAGRKYGFKNIPRRWLDKLVQVDYIVDVAEQLYKLGGTECK